MVDECVIIMCVISEYAEYGYACFSGSWQVGETKIQPVVQLCLCKSYSVLTACIASSLQNQAYPVFSQAKPGHAHKGLRLYRLPRQFHPKGTLLCGHRALSDATPWAKQEQLNAEVSPLESLV